MTKYVNVMRIALILVFFAVLTSSVTAQEGGFGGVATQPNYYFVDAVHGSDDNGGLTPGTAFATIKKGINAAIDGDVVRVYPGLYREEVDFRGKALVVQGIAVGAAGVPVLHNPNDFAVSFYSGEGPDSVLKNFVIKDNFMAIFIAGSSPTLSNLTIVDNMYGIEASDGSNPDISNIIFWNNIYSDLFGCQTRYSLVSDVITGQSNINVDPFFVDEEGGDYRLRSNRGRYWPEHNVWVLDTLTSPCIDGGDPNVETLEEPIPNGNRINIGAYGGTAQASLSPYEPVGLPNQASNPSPADGATDVDFNVTLRWTPGENVASHDVYFGRSNPGQPLELSLIAHQAMNYLDIGFLNGNTTYFWRIDEVNSNGKRVGVLWKFTTGMSTVPPPKGRTCFTADTGVWIDGNLVPISKAAQGQINCGVKSLGEIQEVQEHNGTFTCYDVLLESGNCIGVAENHYFLAESGRWLSLKQLKTGIKLKTSKGSIGVTSVTKRPVPYIGKVYNLNIAGSDRYLIGKDAVVVRDY
jgi:hypothetical protein